MVVLILLIVFIVVLIVLITFHYAQMHLGLIQMRMQIVARWRELCASVIILVPRFQCLVSTLIVYSLRIKLLVASF